MRIQTQDTQLFSLSLTQQALRSGDAMFMLRFHIVTTTFLCVFIIHILTKKLIVGDPLDTTYPGEIEIIAHRMFIVMKERWNDENASHTSCERKTFAQCNEQIVTSALDQTDIQIATGQCTRVRCIHLGIYIPPREMTIARGPYNRWQC